MPGQRPLLCMSFVASLGITFEVLSCTVPKEQANFWPLLVFLFYILLPLPLSMSKRIIKQTALGSLTETAPARVRDTALFASAGIMVSSAALPIVLARSSVIPTVSCILVEIGNFLCLCTMGLFCLYFKPLDTV